MLHDAQLLNRLTTRRLKSEGHYIIGVDWKRNEHMPVRIGRSLVCYEQSRLRQLRIRCAGDLVVHRRLSA